MQISFDSFEHESSNFGKRKLFCLVAGIRGAGKSTTIGTLGVKTLLLASKGEFHAIEAARLFGRNNIIANLYDMDGNKPLKPDQSIAKLHSILDFLLSSGDLVTHIGCLAIDSISAIDNILYSTTRIASEKNGWTAMEIALYEQHRIIDKLRDLNIKGLHIIVTMPIMSDFDEDGLYLGGSPELRGHKTTSSIAGVFDQVLPVTTYNNQHVFQMNLLLGKVSTDKSGKEKKCPFFPRITGLSREDILAASQGSSLLPADLDYIYTLKLAKENS